MQNSRGTFNFTGSLTGQPYADFLLGPLNNDSILYGTTNSYLFSTNYSAFVQDAWKISCNGPRSLPPKFSRYFPASFSDSFRCWMMSAGRVAARAG